MMNFMTLQSVGITLIQKQTSLGSLCLSHARNKEEVLAGIRPIRAPSLNIFYANVEGDIMHATTGRIKDYEGNNPNFIMDPPFKDQFRSYPFETNPFLENPEGGVIYNANQQPYKGVDGYYDYPSRYRVLGKFFKNAENVSVEDTKKLQLSAAISYDKIVLDSVIPILEKKKKNLSQYQIEALNELKSWNGVSSKESVGASIFYELMSHIGINVFSDEFASHDINKFMDTSAYLGSLINIIQSSESLWWDKKDTAYKETRDDIVFDSFFEATRNLKLHFEEKLRSGTGKNYIFTQLSTLLVALNRLT